MRFSVFSREYLSSSLESLSRVSRVRTFEWCTRIYIYATQGRDTIISSCTPRYDNTANGFLLVLYYPLEKCNNFEASRGSRGISVEGRNRSTNGSRVIPRRAMALVHSDHWGRKCCIESVFLALRSSAGPDAPAMFLWTLVKRIYNESM